MPKSYKIKLNNSVNADEEENKTIIGTCMKLNESGNKSVVFWIMIIKCNPTGERQNNKQLVNCLASGSQEGEIKVFPVPY